MSRNFKRNTAHMLSLWKKSLFEYELLKRGLDKAETYHDAKEATDKLQRLMDALDYEFNRYIERELPIRVSEYLKKNPHTMLYATLNKKGR